MRYLKQIENFTKHILNKKVKIGLLYRKIFEENKNYFIPQKLFKNSKPSFWLNSIFFKKLNQNQVKELGEHLIENKIEVRSGFWPLAKMPKFKSIKVSNYKNTNNLFNQLLILPSNIRIKKNDIEYFKKLIDIFHRNKNL